MTDLDLPEALPSGVLLTWPCRHTDPDPARVGRLPGHRFGARRSGSRRSAGVDVSCKQHDTILSPFAGHVLHFTRHWSRGTSAVYLRCGDHVICLGCVGDLHVDVGQIVMPGQPVAPLVDGYDFAGNLLHVEAYDVGDATDTAVVEAILGGRFRWFRDEPLPPLLDPTDALREVAFRLKPPAAC